MRPSSGLANPSSMLSEEIRTRMKAAMKAGRVVEKEILRVCIGEITTEEARHGTAMEDAGVEKILRKLTQRVMPPPGTTRPSPSRPGFRRAR